MRLLNLFSLFLSIAIAYILFIVGINADWHAPSILHTKSPDQ
jgi:hypothetical protein